MTDQVSVPGIKTGTGVINVVGFSQNQVKILSDSDFTLSSKVQVNLVGEELQTCVLILFHGNNSESRELAIIFASAAAQVPSPQFCAINLNQSKKVASSFLKLRSKNTPLRWAGIMQIPYILIYQGGQPVGAYNGSRTVNEISNFALTRACSSSYSEPIQVFKGIKIDNNFGMVGLVEKEVPKTSIEFTESNPIRVQSGAPTQTNLPETASVSE